MDSTAEQACGHRTDTWPCNLPGGHEGLHAVLYISEDRADRPAEPTPPTNDVLTDVKVVAGEPTPTGADRPTTDERVSLEGRIGIRLGLWDGTLSVGGDWEEHGRFVSYLADFIEAEARQQPQPLDVDVERLAELLIDERIGPNINKWSHQREWEDYTTALHRSIDGARLSSDPARPSPTEEPR